MASTSDVTANHLLYTSTTRQARNRARPLIEYDEPTRNAIQVAGHLIDARAALQIWEYALAASPLFTDASREAFVDALGVDDATLARSRGAAIDQAWHKLAALGTQGL